MALGELLARAGSNITTLAIDTPLGVTVNERVRWVDPLQGERFCSSRDGTAELAFPLQTTGGCST